MAPKKKARRSAAPKLKLHVAAPELKLDLGSGQNPAEGFEGVDRFAPNAKHKVHLWDGERWPFEDGSIDALCSTHVIEHIKADYIDTYLGAEVDAFFFFFNEAYRIAKPGATFKLQWPALQSVRAFQDPTHRRFVDIRTMYYLDRNWREANKLDHYLGATCDWVLDNGQPTINPLNAKLPDVVQQQRFIESWNFSEDFVATLRARKA